MTTVRIFPKRCAFVEAPQLSSGFHSKSAQIDNRESLEVLEIYSDSVEDRFELEVVLFF